MVKRVLRSIFSMCKHIAHEVNENKKDIIELMDIACLPVDPYHELPEFDDPFAEWDAMEAAEAASSPSLCAPVGSSRPRRSTRAHSPPHEEEDGDEDDNDEEEEEDNDDYHNEE
ncbi:actin-like protein ARP8 [Setaria italica]|uniref:actin-like protein ARP8 n=1 Tax=Setaria italica TaxID=4555 RepID=UPI000350C42C|nr:actin-like protein ARP8 [Setaria italica]